MKKHRILRRLLFAYTIWSCIFISEQLSCSPQPSVSFQPISTPLITVDLTTGSGEGDVLFRNASSTDAAISLVAEPIVAQSSSEVTFKQGSTLSRVYDGNIPAHQTLLIQAHVARQWEPGDFDFNLRDLLTDQRIGALRVHRTASAIKLDGTDHLKFALIDGTTTRILLHNDDAVEYTVNWTLVNADEVCHGDQVKLQPKALGIIECKPNLPFTWSRLQNLLKKDPSHDGYRLLFFSAQTQGEKDAQPFQSFAAEGTMDFFAADTRNVVSYAVLVSVLFLGGISSLLISYLLPNRLRSLDLKESLLKLAVKTADLSTRIDSRLAVLIRLERSRLSDLLKSRSTLSPDFSTIASQCSTGISTLSARLGLAEQIDSLLARLAGNIADGAPVTKVDEINAHLEAASLLLQKREVGDADLASAAASIAQAATEIDHIGVPDEEFAKDLLDRIRNRLNSIDQGVAQTETYHRIIAAVPGPERTLRRIVAAVTIIAENYGEVDFALNKLALIHEYVLHLEGIAADEILQRVKLHEPRLLESLQLGSWEALRSARLLFREMKDDVFPERIIQALQTEGDAGIEIDPAVAYDQAPLDFSLRFTNQALNAAAAREEIRVEWDFGDGLKEKGWLVTHYFLLRRKERVFKVIARFYNPEGKLIVRSQNAPAEASREVPVRPSEIHKGFGERTMAESIKLFAALLIAVFGLVAGAQDQIQKLDILPGLVAVFLVGFSADSIKRLLTSTPQSIQS